MELLFSLRYALEFCLARVILVVLWTLPLNAADWIARRAGDIGFWIMPARRKIALENLTRAFGPSLSNAERRKIAVRSFESMALGAVELFLAGKIRKNYREHFQLTGSEHLSKALSKNKGVVLAISHLGSWEYLSFLAPLATVKGMAIVKSIKNPRLTRIVNAMRKKIGVVPVRKENSIRTALRALRENYCLAILIDQWAGPQGIWTNFFGHPTSTTSIPARLSLHSGAPILPCFCMRTGVGRYQIQIFPKIEAEDGTEESITQNLSYLLEDQIRKCPEQWIWGHRRWKPRPDNLRKL
jgi:KDO2-lipid IV(A) lauroyltransferase